MGHNDLPSKVRAIFLSDLHLGYRLSSVKACYDLLQQIETQMLYLVGDCFDESRLRLRWHWPESHQRVLEKVFELDASQTSVFVTPGNHDAYFRRADPFSDSETVDTVRSLLQPTLKMNHAESFVHELKDGRRLLVTHGDLFDDVEKSLAGIPKLGSRIFDQTSWLLPRHFVLSLRELFKFVLARPNKIKDAVVAHVIAEGFDGVVFGHLHRPEIKKEHGLIVANCGDWMKNQSFLVETTEGELVLFNHAKIVGRI